MLIANVLKHLTLEASLLAPDFRSFKRQELVFILLNLFLLALLLSTNVLLPEYFGTSPSAVLVLLFVGVSFNVLELLWLRGRTDLSPSQIVALTWFTVGLNMAIAFALASLSFRQDIQYFTLMIAPVFQAAFRLSWRATAVTVALADGLIFYWVWNYFRTHPPVDLNEYIEAGTISLIYAATALLVWALVAYLRRQQTELSRSLLQLEKAKAKLLVEEKLAAVGRFSSAIAHEIRNPVAMISSALATGSNPALTPENRAEMFDIAAKEAARLERLTTDFLAYARPRSSAKVRTDLADSLAYIADICRPRAAERNVQVESEGETEGLWADLDDGQMQQALLNLAMNAIEASPPGAKVVIRGALHREQIIVEIQNQSAAIPPEVVQCMFEPFFTTKSSGTGLGLAIARSIVLAQGGKLLLAKNEPGLVQFSISLPASESKREGS